MKKRMMLCAALLICFAATALAGGAQEKETPEYFKKPAGESVLDTYIYGENMPGVYTYGGSKRDWIHDMAVAEDGRIAITGYTESSDGTLSDRTKTWRAGWVMMLDRDMNVLWNFCSRSGDADHMRCPVFQGDGTLTVLHETEGMQLKIVTLGKDGEELRSATAVVDNKEHVNFSVKGAMDTGYMVRESAQYGQTVSYRLIGWDGLTVRGYATLDEVQVVGERHMLCKTEEDEGWLYVMDGQGRVSKLAKVYDGSSRAYTALISLEDGGAVACGSIWEGTSSAHAQGLISRWDAKGNLVFEMIVTLGNLKDIVKTDRGFAATCAYQENLEGSIDWQLLEFDEQGILCGRRPLYNSEPTTAVGLIARAADGELVCAQAVGEYGYEDVIVSVIKAE